MADQDTDAAVVEFKRLFWAGRKLYGRNNTTDAMDGYQKAAIFASNQGMAAESRLAEAAILETKGQFIKAEQLLESILGEESLRLRGIAWFMRGSVAMYRNQHEQAIHYYRTALEYPDFDKHGYAWNNLGSIYGRLNDNDRAIECILNAIECPSYDTPEIAWFNLGRAFASKHEFDQAIECFQKSLNLHGDSFPSRGWVLLGRAYAEKKEWDQAIKCFLNAIEISGTDEDCAGRAWVYMGMAHATKKEFDQAISCFKNALIIPFLPTPHEVWNMLGDVYRAKGEQGNAEECYRMGKNDTRP